MSDQAHTAIPPTDAPRRAVVLVMIFTTAVIFVGLFAILYYRWASEQEPSSVMIIAATPAFDGAEISIDGIALPQPYRVTLGEAPGRVIPFYLDRGSYTLLISRDGHTIYSANFALASDEGRQLNLKALEHLLPPAVPPSGTPQP